MEGQRCALEHGHARPDPVPLNLTPDLAVLGFTLGMTVATALLVGTLPAFRATSLEFTPALKDGRGSSSSTLRFLTAALSKEPSLLHGQVLLFGEFFDIHGVCGVPLEVSDQGWRVGKVGSYLPEEERRVNHAAVSIKKYLTDLRCVSTNQFTRKDPVLTGGILR